MPSTSPGYATSSVPPTEFVQVFPGAPAESLQAATTFTFRQRRYIAYICGRQLNVLCSPTKLIQVLAFEEELVAVAAEEETGKIAVAGKREPYILEPFTEGWTKIWWEKSLYLRREDAGDETRTLSWGTEGELLIGGTRRLHLFSSLPSSRTSSAAVSPADDNTAEDRAALWSKYLASPVQYASFSPSANLIASCGKYDRLVKIWRRLSFEGGLFDYTYLLHSSAVTHLEWRPLDIDDGSSERTGITGRREEDPEILYTLASDGVLRVWRTGGFHDLDILVLHTSIDLVSTIPESPSLSKRVDDNGSRSVRYAFFVPADAFTAAVKVAVGRTVNKTVSHALEHLREMTLAAPDVIVTLDGRGRMSAWGLQSIGHKRRPETPNSNQPFHISHAEGLPLHIPGGVNARFLNWCQGDGLNILMHSFDGHLQWWQGGFESLFSPSSSGDKVLTLVSDWTGHDDPISRFSRHTGPSDHVLSGSEDAAIVLWESEDALTFKQRGGFEIPNRKRVHAISLYADSRAALTVHDEHVALWDLSGQQLASAEHDLEADASLTLHHLPHASRTMLYDRSAKVVALDIDVGGKTLSAAKPIYLHGTATPSLQHSVLFPRAGRTACISIDDDGVLFNAHLQTDLTEGRIGENALLKSKQFRTGVALASGLHAHEDMAVVVSRDRKRLALLDVVDGYIEHTQSFETAITDVRILQSSPHSDVVAVASQTAVSILAKGRYSESRSWSTVRRLGLNGLSLQVSAVTWSREAAIAIGAGTVILNAGNTIPAAELALDLRQQLALGEKSAISVRRLASRMTEPLPLWHPERLLYMIREGAIGTVGMLLQRLNEKLKFWTEGEPLSLWLDIELEDILQHKSVLRGPVDDAVESLTAQLNEKRLPGLSDNNVDNLQRVIEAFAFTVKQSTGLDSFATIYLFEWKLQTLALEEDEPYTHGINGVHPKTPRCPRMNWREITFASQSTTQQPLLDMLILQYDNKMTWEIASALGVTAWLSDREALAQVFEALAQTSYRQTTPPDPINASLFFLALHKKQTLLALWRIATWHKEQRATMNFLKRDFSKPDAKTAAKKNAYALMGKRRFEYAAAFFLLADDPASATSLLAGQCEDIMLAIAVARLYSGDHADVTRKLLEQRLIQQATQSNDRWLLSWCHTMLNETPTAADVLLRPFEGVRYWQQDDPLTLVLYKKLRKSPSEHEYATVSRSARILRRMGLSLSALQLVSTWEFARAPGAPGKKAADGVDIKAATATENGDMPSMLDAYDKPAVDGRAERQAKAAELLQRLKAQKNDKAMPVAEKPKPTQFKEPEANSLLDSFGF